MGNGYGHNWAIYLVLWATTWIIPDEPKPNFKDHLNELIPKNRSCNFLLTPEDAHLTTPQVLDRYGYPNEIHLVTTNDGFILEIHRIPSPGRPVVLLVHVLGSSSRDFLVNCEKRALPFKLADGGYDVWMSNYRGNSYTTHKTWTKDNPKFWDYSIDEWAQVDTPATIDYILNETRQSQLSFVGMSLGNAVAFLMLSVKPQYNQKVNIWFAMGATLDLGKLKLVYPPFFFRFGRLSAWIMKLFNRGAAISLLFHPLLPVYLPKFCASDSQLKNPNSICSNILFPIHGYDPGQIPPEVMVILAGGFPQQSSMKSVVHFLQWMDKEHFAMYDYGPWKNLIHYGTFNAPLYPVEKITTSVVLFKAQNDLLTPQGFDGVGDVFKDMKFPIFSKLQYMRIRADRVRIFPRGINLTETFLKLEILDLHECFDFDENGDSYFPASDAFTGHLTSVKTLMVLYRFTDAAKRNLQVICPDAKMVCIF